MAYHQYTSGECKEKHGRHAQMQNELVDWKWWDLFSQLKEIMALSAFIRQLLLWDLKEVLPIFDLEALSLRACV